VSRVVEAEFVAPNAEWLAGTRSGPKRDIWRYTSPAKGEWPATNPTEPVTLDIPFDVFRSNVDDASLIDDACRQISGINEGSEPGCCIGVIFVVVVLAMSHRPASLRVRLRKRFASIPDSAPHSIPKPL
jgi:hypothetical protein